jgi:FtsP/CotA-like multicopper oxidase with cupredoxin domain
VARLGGNPDSTVEGYIYNDGDGSTAYDVEYVIQLSAFDHNFHDANEVDQPLPVAAMIDTYPMINGRGYPDTTVTDLGDLPKPADSTADPHPQPVTSLIEANAGDRVLLRLSNVGVVRQYTVTALGLPMKVIGRGARLLRGQGQGQGEDVFIETNTVTLGGGESADVIIDTTDAATGTYFLYTTNLNYLSNNEEDYGGMMTEIVIN